MLVAQHMAQAFITGEAPPPMGVRRPAWPIYDIFDTADGGQVFVGVVTDTQWRLFCQSFGLHGLAADPALATQQQRTAARDRTIPVIAAALRRLDQARADGPLRGARACRSRRSPSPADLFDDPHLNASGGLVPLTLPDGRTVRLPALPLSFDGQRLAQRHDLPAPGEHNDAILQELGSSRG